MGLEYEIKLVPTEEKYFLLLEASFQEAGVHFDMATTYYDTPGRELRKRAVTLRKRMENGKAVCTLKTPAELGRNEYQVEKDTVTEAIPELCRQANAPELAELLKSGVEEVCGARFHRIAQRLTLTDGVVEVCIDRGELLGGGSSAPLLEVEIELIEGDPKGVQRNAAALCVAYRFKEEKKSKFVRAFRLAQEAENGI